MDVISYFFSRYCKCIAKLAILRTLGIYPVYPDIQQGYTDQVQSGFLYIIHIGGQGK